MIKKIINITKTDIKCGARGACTSCPIALAIKRVVKGWNVEVGSHTVLFNRRGDQGELVEFRVSTPFKMKEFIANFDNGYRVYPSKLTIELPEGILK